MVAVRVEDSLPVGRGPTPVAVEQAPLAPRDDRMSEAVVIEFLPRAAGLAGAANVERLPEHFIDIIPFDFRPVSRLELGLKRAMDVAGALVGLLLLSPVFALAALALLAAEGRPVLFRQPRVGRGGKPFTIVKFRTMAPDADERYAEVAALSDTTGAAFKMTNDPRITPLGRLLRRTSIDELPQLWNVLRGEMSLVGPRPAPPREVILYEPWHLQRLKVKPGITGAWQVTARLDDDFDRRAQLDIDYVERWSILLDVQIILATIPALIRQPGR